MPIKADRVSYAAGINIQTATILVYSGNCTKELIFWFTNIAGGSNRHIEFPIRSEFYEFPPVPFFTWQSPQNNLAFRRIAKTFFDVNKLYDAVNFSHIKISIQKSYTIGHIQALCYGDDFVSFIVTILIYH